MNQKELFFLFRITCILLILSFSLFILSINVYKLVDFIVTIDDIIKNIDKDKPLVVAQNDFNSMEDDDIVYFNNDKAHTAKQLGYVDKLSLINGSEWGEGINLLLVGSDKKNFQVSKSRADIIVLLRITKTGKILTISIPRDTLVKIKDGKWAGKNDKIGHSLYWGGMNEMKRSVEDLVGSPIYKIITIDNFRSFEAFLSIIGGIHIDKDLEGKLGVQWIRNRQFKFGDIERCKRQELFFSKAIKKIWKITKGGNYYYSIFIYDALKRIVQTDLTKDEFLNILYCLKINNFNPENDYYTSVLDGNFGKYDSELMNKKNLTCWTANIETIQKIQFVFYNNDTNENFIKDNKVVLWNFMKIDLKMFFTDFNNKYIKNYVKETKVKS
jgi:anionic cell wall polymer biosynthesis LytR-Cps2A-Psr (LCP) family protein